MDDNPNIQVSGNEPISKPENIFAKLLHKRILLILLLLLITIPLVVVLVFRKQPQQEAPKAAISPTPPSKYAQKATENAVPFLQGILTTTYSPTTITTNNLKRQDGTIVDEKTFVATHQYSDNSILFYRVRYRNQQGALDYKYVDMFLPQTLATLTQAGAQQAIGQYVTIQPQGTWKCALVKTNGGQTTQCENFWTDTIGIKKGIGVVQETFYKNEKRPVLFYCELYRSGTAYKKNTCSSYVKN